MNMYMRLVEWSEGTWSQPPTKDHATSNIFALIIDATFTTFPQSRRRIVVSELWFAVFINSEQKYLYYI